MPGAAAAGQGGASSGGSGNPFQLATNLYCEKNNQGTLTQTSITTSQQPQGAQINAGQYLRGVRLVVRCQGAAGSTSAYANAGITDWPWNILTQVDMVNVDGSEILYVMGGYAHYLAQKYTRPWQGDPNFYSDAAAATNLVPQFTLFLQPEIRWTAGCLANTDTRSQYRFDYTLDTLANIVGANVGSYNSASAPVISVTPYVDAWAQPDAEDLQGVPNQPVPPGLNLQYKRRHQIFTMNAASSDNIFQSALTGNALRCQILVTRNGGTVRAEGLTDSIQWSIDNRSLGKISTNVGSAAPGTASTSGSQGGDMVQNWMSQFYGEYFSAIGANVGAAPSATVTTARREAGVYVFPRFIKPGTLDGQGWLYTSNSTKEIFESSTPSSGITNGTMELITSEVYPVGPVDPQITDI